MSKQTQTPLRHGEETAPWQGHRPLRVLLLGNGERAHVHAEADRVRAVIEQHAEIVLSDFQRREDLQEVSADFAVVLGGDGSILHAVKQLGPHQIPVVGVNLGKLGFLAAISPDQFQHVFPDICRGKCRIVDHLMLACHVLRDQTVIHHQLGLNEAAIMGGAPFSIIDIDLYIDAVWATTYSCDGLIISTPVGSTAHNLSAGGPILRKNMQAFVISPISPHTLTVRPVVDRADRIYELVAREPHASVCVVVDGRMVCQLTAGDRVRICQAEPRFHMIEVGEQNYYRTLREKLGWRGHIRH
ncbi:MAG: NAD(+)/NADH kinase [Planctomycetota bacterium]